MFISSCATLRTDVDMPSVSPPPLKVFHFWFVHFITLEKGGRRIAYHRCLRAVAPTSSSIRSNPSPPPVLESVETVEMRFAIVHLFIILVVYMLCPLPVLSQPPPLLWICWDWWGQVRYYTDFDEMIVMRIVVVVILTPQTMTALIWSLVVYWAPLNLLRLLGSGTLLYR